MCIPCRDIEHDPVTPRSIVRLLTLDDRASGVLLHPTSLPGPHGCGDLGQAARDFLGFLTLSEQRWWQMLPVGPPGYGNSPYSAQSAFAGSPLLIALEPLVEENLLDPKELLPLAPLPHRRVDYGATWAHRSACLRKAWRVAAGEPRARRGVDAFVEANREWAQDFALFRALKHQFGEVEWTRWPTEYRDRNPDAMARARRDLAGEIGFELFCQSLFARQWRRLREDAAARGIGLIGDIPIFLAHDSADVWQHRELFRLGSDGLPTHVAGVPPDYFSTTGQRWGNPLYRWSVLRKTGYAWWVARLRQMLERFDAIRLDHFIGFQRYWEIPAGSPTAVDGRWMKGPGASFFEAVRNALGSLPLIAEDLGAVTPAVKRLRDQFRLPGIRLLQFAFGSDPSAPDFKPHNYRRRCVAYTGTHDNDTTVGWFYEKGGGESTRSEEQTEKERQAALAYLGTTGGEIHWEMMRAVHMSVARLAMFPLQDVLGLGSEARMNRPGTSSGNWEWRFETIPPEAARRLAAMTRTYERSGRSEAGAR